MFLSVVFNLFFLHSFATVQPPTDSYHPGSISYDYDYEKVEENFKGRESYIFYPKNKNEKTPVVFFGHGQALNLDSYDETFKHFAKKGYAIVFPKYDSGFFDQQWRRMADDFNEISQMFLDKYQNIIDSEKIIFSGHSKGGYIALMAAGAPSAVESLKGLVLFAPAGFDNDYLKALKKTLPITLAWGETDDIIKRQDVEEIYNKLKVDHKQFITLSSYDDHEADHYYILNKSGFFGGKNGISGFHYHSVWKWIGGALLDSEQARGSEEELARNEYLYGDEASSTGVDGLRHEIKRSW